ncbi:hypothetical protein VaNZ11_004857 [Volvox africanus]|uniref:Sulphur transport domain-containing protein n=1 Tax=Volvox africanus TaxID=51714 RepID=A0ABQ5RX93_9CHLO|nr:hypothetical protein VaNZ11_004857 [Volvox africanus]
MATTLFRIAAPRYRATPISLLGEFLIQDRSKLQRRGYHAPSHGLHSNVHQAHILLHSRSSKKMLTTSAIAEVTTAVSAAAAGTSAGGYTLLSFTPATAVLGGLLLGIATAGKLLTTGRVLGISGAVKGLVAGDLASWRFAFLMGMALGSVALTATLPGAFEVLPQTFTVWRAVLAGLLVGVGSSMGNGCTSGHGICGSARLSPRSFAYTATFMASGMLTATLTGSAAALKVAPLPAALAMPTVAEAQLAAVVAAGGIATFAALAAAKRFMGEATPRPPRAHGGSSEQQLPQSRRLELASELLAGCIFALGLGLSGMSRPSKVAGFLTLGLPSWDPSLPFVMAGAVAVAMVAYQGVMRFRMMSKPLFCPTFQIPSSSLIDTKLLGGGVIFGAGWGLAGICPGPALVAAMMGDPRVLGYIAAMVGGMLLQSRLETLVARLGSKDARWMKPMTFR